MWWIFGHKGEEEIMCGGSPLISKVLVLSLMFNLFHVGEIHRRGDIINYTRSPLSEPV